MMSRQSCSGDGGLWTRHGRVGDRRRDVGKEEDALDAEIDALRADGPPARAGRFFWELRDALPVCRVVCQSSGECGWPLKKSSGDGD